MSGVLVVIPARYGSRRFPGKALADLGGRPLVVRVAEAAGRMRRADAIVVATDDERIADAVAAAGFEACMTGEHPSGTDRVGEAVAGRDARIVLNLQGDEPLLDPADLDGLVAALETDPAAGIGTLAHPLADAREWRDPDVVKVLVSGRGRALWFSRLPLPAVRDGGTEGWRLARRHVGVYAYRRDALDRFLAAPPTPLERAESLEQLRALELGIPIVVAPCGPALGVDTPDDLERVRRLWDRRD